MIKQLNKWLDHSANSIAFGRRNYYFTFRFVPSIFLAISISTILLYDADTIKYEILWGKLAAMVFIPTVILGFANEIIFRVMENHANGIRLPPAYGIDRLLRFLFPKKAYERVFAQTVSDFRLEYAEMLAERRLCRAEWLAVCLVGTLAITAAVWISATIVKRVVSIWRLS